MEFLCIDILNSNRVDWQSSTERRDMLEDTTWLANLLNKWGLATTLPIDINALNRLKKLRHTMYGVITGMKNGVPFDKQLNFINAELKSTSSRISISFQEKHFKMNHIYDKKGWDFVVWSAAQSFADILCYHDITRLKICNNDNCGWVFYDESKNKSRRWCDDKACGNIMKVRRFRSRQKAAQELRR